jgi:2-octaprenyl-6-methoxyphenol hydroxylase
MTETADVVIAGAGPVGAVCALALLRAGYAPRVLEARPAAAVGSDTRTLALSHGTRLILERLGVWERLNALTPITRIHISQRGGLGTTHLDAVEVGVPALGYVLGYATLAAALAAALAEAGIDVRYGTAVERVLPGTPACVETADRHTIDARLAIIADGGRGASTPALTHDYRQAALVCEVETELPHRNLAYERFTPDGPAALLPHGQRYALVWTAPPDVAAQLANLSDEQFLDRLYRHVGGRQGRFLAATPRRIFPLTLALAAGPTLPGVVRIGNAAHTLHPVSGQGFNIGIRDAWELAAHAGDAPQEMGSRAWLRGYAAGRRSDVLGGAGFTDFLVRVFSNDLGPLRHARGLGLMALEVLPPLKAFVARRMIFGARG